MPVHVAVHADDLLHDARDRAQVVRDHHDGHAAVQLAQRLVELLLEAVVHEVRRFVENQQPRLRNHGAAQQRPLHLPARHLADGVVRSVGKPRHFEQMQRLVAVPARVARAEAALALQTREHHLEQRDRKGPVEVRNLRHVADQALLAAEKLRGVIDAPAVGHGAQNGPHERGLAAAVGTDDSEKILRADLQIDVLQRLVPVVDDADIMQGDEIHWATIRSVSESMLAMISSFSGSIATLCASMSRAITSTAEAGNWLW